MRSIHDLVTLPDMDGLWAHPADEILGAENPEWCGVNPRAGLATWSDEGVSAALTNPDLERSGVGESSLGQVIDGPGYEWTQAATAFMRGDPPDA